MDKEYKDLQMEILIKECMKKVNLQGMASITGSLVASLKAILKVV
jgi:hypothetical protein